MLNTSTFVVPLAIVGYLLEIRHLVLKQQRNMLLYFLFTIAAELCMIQAVSPNDVLNEEWEAFKIRFKKNYSSNVEEEFRKNVYIENKHKIADHNKNYSQGVVKFSLGMNEFGDMLHHEFLVGRMGWKRNYKHNMRHASTFLETETQVPKEIDWVKLGYVTPVKNQGDCGGCWSFSATGALEGQHKRKTGNLVSLSEQNLIDCSRRFGNDGCEGGLPNYAFQYIESNNGIDTEKSYPFQMRDGMCRFNRSDVGASDLGYEDIPKGNEEALKIVVGTIGPVSVGIDASLPSFQFYQSGVYDPLFCSSENIDHAVLVAGYGSQDENDYWLVKNSWGTSWGIDGYILMSRNKNNQCGIASMASYPLV